MLGLKGCTKLSPGETSRGGNCKGPLVPFTDSAGLEAVGVADNPEIHAASLHTTQVSKPVDVSLQQQLCPVTPHGSRRSSPAPPGLGGNKPSPGPQRPDSHQTPPHNAPPERHNPRRADGPPRGDRRPEPAAALPLRAGERPGAPPPGPAGSAPETTHALTDGCSRGATASCLCFVLFFNPPDSTRRAGKAQAAKSSGSYKIFLS